MADATFERDELNGLVSVVIATYCGAPYIREALDSVARQAYPHWELIVVEDGSNDGTEQIVREFAQRHSKHRVDYSRSERNYGLGRTRNQTFARVRGSFVAILDADDRWMPEHLAATVGALMSSGKDIAYSTSIMFENQSEILLGTWGPSPDDLRDFPQSLFGRSFITPSATVLRRKVLADVGPWDTFTYGEDFSYWLRCVAAQKQFQHVTGCHVFYRKHHGGAISTSLSAMIGGVAEVAERFMNLPGTRVATCRDYLANSYALAAKLNVSLDPKLDPSADQTRAPQLLWKAWRLQPSKIRYLWEAAKIGIMNMFWRRNGVISVRPQHDAQESVKSTLPERAA